jgi:hypothetical protein
MMRLSRRLCAGGVRVARISLSLYEEEGLLVEVQGETVRFRREVVYFTLGGFGTPDMVCLHLSPAQLAAVGTAIAAYQARTTGRTGGGEKG